MKTLLILLFAMLSLVSHSQDVRSFYQSSSKMGYSTIMLNINAELHFLSIKESSTTALRLAIGKLDEDLNTSEYRYLELPFTYNAFIALSGAAVNGNILTAVVMRRVGSVQKVDYHHIDLVTFTLQSTITLTQDFRTGFHPSKIKGNKLISYLPTQMGQILRLEKDLTQLANPTVEVIDGGSNASSGFSSVKVGDLQFINDTEFYALRSNYSTLIVKRTLLGIDTVTVDFTATPFGHGLLALSNGNLVVSNSRQYAILNGNLDSLSGGLHFQESIDPIDVFFGMEQVGNQIIEIRPRKGLLVNDLSMNFIEFKDKERTLKYNGSFKMNNDSYFYGETIDYGVFAQYDTTSVDYSQISNLFVIANDGKDKFSEYGGKFIQNDRIVNAGHCNSSRIDNEAYTGKKASMQFQFHGRKINDMYSIGEYTVGLGTDANYKGTFSTFYQTTPALCLPGPINSGNVEFNEQMDKYNRGYFVSRQMIEDHLSVLFYGNPNYVPEYGIRNWPAHGNTANGEAANLAEFVDINNNGIYEPMLGDYPKIYGDQCLLFVYHQDPQDPASNSLEFHEYYFSFDCDTSAAFKNTVFKNLKIINRGSNLSNVNVGTYIDFDLGSWIDDYAGTHVNLGLIYVYNGDAFDETNSGAVGFYDTIPAIGMMILKGAKLVSDGIDNQEGAGLNQCTNGVGFGDAIVDNEFVTLSASKVFTGGAVGAANSDPTTLGQYNLFGLGLFGDGSPKYAPNGTPIRHDLYGSSDPQYYSSGGLNHGNNYAESGLGNLAGDRRMLASSGSGNLLAGDTLDYLTAYVTSFDSINLSPQNSLNQLFVDAAIIKNAFNTNNAGCGNTFGTIQQDLSTTEVEAYDVLIYPNPFINSFRISNLGISTSHISIRDVNGKLVFETKVNHNIVEIPLEVQGGIYLVQVTNELGSVVKRLVKH